MKSSRIARAGLPAETQALMRLSLDQGMTIALASAVNSALVTLLPMIRATPSRRCTTTCTWGAVATNAVVTPIPANISRLEDPACSAPATKHPFAVGRARPGHLAAHILERCPHYLGEFVRGKQRHTRGERTCGLRSDDARGRGRHQSPENHHRKNPAKYASHAAILVGRPGLLGRLAL